MSVDVLLENARIVDGTGAPWFHGSVAVSDGIIQDVIRRPDPTLDIDERIDLNEAMVAPGFIDAHSHSDLRMFEDPTLESKLRQGITTEILGQDGFSFAPMYREGGASEWADHLSGLAGDVTVEWTWGSVAEYLDAIDRRGTALNLATLVGHGTVRYDVLGLSDHDPTGEELVEMGDLVTEALEDGAIGFSTGLVYPPQVNASTEEVRALASRLHPYGRPFVAHIRSEGRMIWSAFDEFIDIGASEEIPLHVSHFKVSGKSIRGAGPDILTLFDAARRRGVDLTADKYPYTAGNTMLSAVLPPWVHSEGPERVRELLEDEAARTRMKHDIDEWRIDGWENNAGKTGWENLVVTNVSSEDLDDVEGRTIDDIAADWDVRPIDAVCEILLEEDMAVSMITHSQSESDVRAMLKHDHVAIGTDALFGGRPHPRTYGTYPRVIGHYARDEKLFSIEEAVRKMTSLPARAMGLNRGIVRPGMPADLVVFDPDVVGPRATYDEPRQFPTGIPHVMVNGSFVLKDGDLTGELPGEAIRSPGAQE